MDKLKNLAYLFIFGAILLALKFLVVDVYFPALPQDAGIWFTSGLLLIILGVFVTEKYFTRSLDVIVNIVTLGVVLLTLDHPNLFRLWGGLLWYGGIVGALALTGFVLYDEKKDAALLSQKIANSSSVIARFLGSSRMLFSIVFLLSIFNYFVFTLEQNQAITGQQVTIFLLIGFWAMVLLIVPIDKKLIQPLIEKLRTKDASRLVGKIARRISPNIVVVEMLPSASALKAGALAMLGSTDTPKEKSPVVMYLYSQDADDKRYGFFYALTENTGEISKHMYAHSVGKEMQTQVRTTVRNNELYKNRKQVIGVVHTGSEIDVLKIKMIEGADEAAQIKEGDLVSVNLYGHATKYQIINAETASESVEGSNKQGGKIVTAQQIGFWKDEKQQFENMGWVPEMNSPVFLESEGEQIVALEGAYFKVGLVPKSKYPIYINLEESVTHHIAIIGKTGTGKSRMAAKVLEKMAQQGYRVVIFEVDRKHKQSLTKYIDATLIAEQDSAAFDLTATEKPVVSINLQMDARDRAGGTVNMSDLAATLIEKVIKYQLEHEDKKICIAMEEAYDFIPENSFGKQDFGQPNVSRISQMVLKCRKHNIGFLIITQRTALVTKTILYQCHTIIALQSFDETSKNFMGAYINQKYLDSMSILPRFRAIVVGKGSSCDKPVIVDFFDHSARAPAPVEEVTAAQAEPEEIADAIVEGMEPEVV